MASKKTQPPRVPQFKDPFDIIKFMRKLMQLNLDKKLPNGTLHVQTNAVNALLRILVPREPMQITQQVTTGASKEQIISEFIGMLPAELRNALVAYGQQQARLVEAPSASQPP